MTKKEKHAAYLGIILFLLAAIFSISLITGLLDFGHSSGSIFYSFGKTLINSYGFCSILIPIYILTAGFFCFSAKWNLQKAVALLISPIPFFTLAIAERTAHKIANTDISSVAFMKIIFLLLIAILLAVAEYLLSFIISSKIYAKKHNLNFSSKDKTSENFDEDFSDEFDGKVHDNFEQENSESENLNLSEINDFDDLDEKFSDEENNFENQTENLESSGTDDIWSLDDEGNVKNKTDEKEFAENSENEFDENQTENTEENFAEDFTNLENQNHQNAEETKYFDDPWNVTGNANKNFSENSNPQIKNQNEMQKNSAEFNDTLDFDSIISSFEKDSIGFEEDEPQKKDEIHYEINFDEDENQNSVESKNFSSQNQKNNAFLAEKPKKAEADFEDIFYTADNNSQNDDLDNAINMALDLDSAEDKNYTDGYNEDEFYPLEAVDDFAPENSSPADDDLFTEDADEAEEAWLTEDVSVVQQNFTPAEDVNDATEDLQFTEDALPAEDADEAEDAWLTEESAGETQKFQDKTFDFSDLKNQNQQDSKLSSLNEIFSKMDEDARQKVKEESLEEKSALNQNPQVQQNPQSQIQNQNFSVGKTAVITDENGNTRAIPVVPKKKRGPYQISTELLTKYEENPYWEIDDETKEAAKSLHETLAEFNIEAEVIAIRKGPVVTMFEILPAPGVNLNKIRSLQDNIALRLAAKSVRIVAPIPGKKAVGIEIPNKKRAVVSFRECIEENRPEWKKMQIPVVLGKDIEGTSQIMDLAKTPHLLIAGATGAGKSVCVNSMILSILYKRSPSDVKLILIDPKIVELSLYNGIGHLLTPVITEPKAAMQALNYCICEMERRYAVLKGMGCREIVGYNQKIKEQHIATEKLPYIIIVIDEFADLMATAGKQMEAAIARLAAKSRAVGIHLVLATQRPSVDVITGLIKANIPSRIAFMVASRTDSNIIIDKTGAEKLLGKGDMLYSSASDPFPIRIQGTLVSDKEVENVVDAVKDCWGEPDYIDDEIFIDDDENEDSEQASLFSDGADDPLYEKALDIVIQAGKASASYIQRKLSIGYNRAARLVELMEERGIVGPANGSKPREIIHIP